MIKYKVEIKYYVYFLSLFQKIYKKEVINKIKKPFYREKKISSKTTNRKTDCKTDFSL